MFVKVMMYDAHSEVDFGEALVNLNNVIKIIQYNYKGNLTLQFVNGDTLTIKETFEELEEKIKNIR